MWQREGPWMVLRDEHGDLLGWMTLGEWIASGLVRLGFVLARETARNRLKRSVRGWLRREDLAALEPAAEGLIDRLFDSRQLAIGSL